MNFSHKTFWAVTLLLVLGMGVTLYQGLFSQAPERAAFNAAGIVLLPQGRGIPEINLLDHQGKALSTTAALQGHWSLVFLGYTFCPDICPTTLSELRQLYGALPEGVRPQLKTLMVTVDPDRDTPEQLRGYLAYFSPDFLGLTGTLPDIQALSVALGIPFIPGDTRKAGYTVDHSGNLAIVGPDGRLRGFVRAPLNPALLAQQLPKLLAMPQ